MNLVFIDNFDSFSYNIVHYFQVLGAHVSVLSHNELKGNLDVLLSADGVVVGPGPNTPLEAGELMEILPLLVEGNKNILGVCLGHQAIAQYFGWSLEKAQRPMHGKVTWVQHAQTGITKNIPTPMPVGRYHSLIVNKSNNSDLMVDSVDECGQVMAFHHKSKPIWGLQYHPESVLTDNGMQILQNWLSEIS